MHRANTGRRGLAEALRRGLRQADQVITLADGAPWLWRLVTEYFRSAIQIVDLYHARKHLTGLGKVVYGPIGIEAKQWAASRSTDLDAGKVEAVIDSGKQIQPRHDHVREEIRKAVD